MARKYLVTEDEFLSANVDPEDGHLKFTRDSGEVVDAGPVTGEPGPKGDPGDRGLPGPGAVPAVEAVAAYIEDDTSEVAAALNSKIVELAGGTNLPRTIAKLRAGQDITIGVVGDSKSDPTTPGNAGGGPVEKLAAFIEQRFGVTVTVANGAESGATMATQFLRGKVGEVAAARPDLLVVHIGTNDTNSDANSVYAPGYLRAASLAAVERAVAYVRDAREDAEALFVGTGPYRSLTSPSNEKLLDYATDLKALAATVGAEWVDAYAAFIEYAETHGGSIDALMYDSTHQNAAGNDLYAQTMLKSFPDVSIRVAPSLAPRARIGHYGINRVAKEAGLLGYQIVAASGTVGGLTYALSGSGWTVDGTYDVTSTVGDAITLTADAREFLYSVDMATNPVLDFVLDGVVVAADVNVSALSAKNATTYWLAPFLDLPAGEHDAQLVLKGGTLRVQSTAALINAAESGGDFTPETRVVTLGTVATAAVDSTGAYTDHFTYILRVPDGWEAMSVQFIGTVTYRTTAATTEPRAIQARIEYTHGPFDQYLVAPADTAGVKSWFSTSFAHFVETVAGDATVTLRSRVLSTEKASVGTTAGSLRAILTRTA